MGRLLILSAVVTLWVHAGALANDERAASSLFRRLTGSPLFRNDPRHAKLVDLIRQNRMLDAARVATDDDRFYDVTLKHWATALSNRLEDVVVPLNDFVAMVVGTVRDGRDFREILSGNYIYVGPTKVGDVLLPDPLLNNPLHFQTLESLQLSLRRTLSRKEPQRPDFPDTAGVLTSFAWGQAHFDMGTNRRAVEFAFKEFLCTTLEQVRDTSVSDARIRRDVDRRPGGIAHTYLNNCRGCHAGMDALAGAFAHFRYGFSGQSFQVIYDQKIQKKMNQNGDVYPEGFVTIDDSWLNLWTQNQNASLGWRGSIFRGNGVSALGQMLANSQAFSRCMGKRVFHHVCRREPVASEDGLISGLAQRFEGSGYQLRQLFEETAITAGCVPFVPDFSH